MDLPFFFPLPTVATFGADVSLVLGSKDKEDEVSANIRTSAESFVLPFRFGLSSGSLPSSLVVYVICLHLLFVGGGDSDGDGDGDTQALRCFDVDHPLLYATFIVPHLTHTHTAFNCFSH